MSAENPFLDHPEPIRLSNCKPFGVGGRRACYVHPHEPKFCIKVLRQDDDRTVRIRKSASWIPARLRREYNNNQDERDTLNGLQKKIGPKLREHFPWCHGEIDTDLGQGLVLDLVRDYDGRISYSLREHITRGLSLEEVRPAFERFARFLMKHRIITKAILDHNLALSKVTPENWQFYLIDGMGTNAFFPFSSLLPALAYRKINQKIEEAWTRFEAFSAQGGVSDQLRKESTWGQGFLNHRDDASHQRLDP